MADGVSPTGERAVVNGADTVPALRASIPDAGNLALWKAVEKTDPRHTKKVNQRGGFTAISAHYQVLQATEQFGPVGIGWGYVNHPPIWQDDLVIVPVTIWHGSRDNSFGPVYGGAEWRSKGRLDSDAPKKAATDGLTKALSHLGFNADVFLGRFDDNKYVEQLEAEFAASERDGGHSQDGAVSSRPAKKPSPPRPDPRTKLEGPYPSWTGMMAAHKELDRDLRSFGDSEEFEATLASDDVQALKVQLLRYAPWTVSADYELPADVPEQFEPLSVLVTARRSDFAILEQLKEPA